MVYLYIMKEEVGVGKPDIRVFQMALERMDVSAEDTWMVGDNLEWDRIINNISEHS